MALPKYGVFRGAHVSKFTPFKGLDGNEYTVFVFATDQQRDWMMLAMADAEDLARTKKLEYISVRNKNVDWLQKRLWEVFGYVECHVLMPNEVLI